MTGLLHDWFRRDIEVPLATVVGGPARLKVIVLLACVLGLNAADMATIGAVAAPLERALQIGNVEIGWLVAVPTGMGALVTLPFGALADRIHRTRLLVITIAVWSLAMAVGGAATSYSMLLWSRLFLGAAIAASTPAVISLTGDFFRPGERGRIFGYILAGELIGVAVGFLISGNVAAIASWRFAFWILAGLGGILAAVIWRLLPEPARGGQSQIPVGAAEVPGVELSHATPDTAPAEACSADAAANEIKEKVDQRHIEPHDSLLHRDPANMSLWQAVRYVLSIRTFRGLVIASALGYFYFTGLRTFAIVFMRDRFELGQAVASTVSVVMGLGAVGGVLLTGRLGDALIARGRLNGRVLMGAAAYLIATAAFLPGLLVGSLYIAAPFFVIAAAGIGGANPVVDAARLDVIPSRLWGRAEGVRSALRLGLVAIAPPLFGYVSTWFGAEHRGISTPTPGSSSAGTGLEQTFLIMLLPLAAAGLLLLFRAAKTYPRDVATAIAVERARQPEQ